ncbi:hypothetical protein [Devosia chinhatensis]|uniref:Chalcone isomerase domain-containing protein n=1 Tax=Devosia chinhatensis TaxID=429727 RepID=A0A0F5FIJ2_9HYPH|nr:hypothetical protein [Devosia chinhatensis]KKB08666.1 hypothetical protein VE26_00815 [Devosia chinhatensis]
MFREPLATVVALTVLSLAPAGAQEVTDYLGVPGPISIGGNDYVLSWSSNPQPGYFKQEYIPAGADAQAYETMVLVEFLASDLPMAEVISAQTDMINQRKATDPIANMAMFSNPERGEIVLDFLLSDKDDAGEYIIEWNGYRYGQAQFEGEDGVLLFGLSDRAYGNDDAETFLRGLGDFKTQRILALTTAEMPEVE